MWFKLLYRSLLIALLVFSGAYNSYGSFQNKSFDHSIFKKDHAVQLDDAKCLLAHLHQNEGSDKAFLLEFLEEEEDKKHIPANATNTLTAPVFYCKCVLKQLSIRHSIEINAPPSSKCGIHNLILLQVFRL